METEVKTAGEVLGGLDADDPLARVGVVVTKENPSIPVSVESPKPGVIKFSEAEEYLKHPNKPTAEQQTVAAEGGDKESKDTEVTPEAAAERALRLGNDDMVWDEREGKARPWKEFLGLAQLKRDTDADKFRLAKEAEVLQKSKDYVDQNLPFLEAVSQSRFATTLANTLRQGVSEENAIAAAFAAIGKSPSATPNAQPVSDDPEPFVPPSHEFDKDNPEHLDAAMEHMRWEYRHEAQEAARKIVAPIQAELAKRDAADAAEKQRQLSARTELDRIATHNKQMAAQIKAYLSFDPDTLSEEQRKDFQRKIDEAAPTIGLTDEYVATHALTERDIIAVAAKAFPHANPYAPPVSRQIVVPGATKKPLQPGSNGGGGLQSGTPAGWMNPADEIRAKLEAMASGKM